MLLRCTIRAVYNVDVERGRGRARTDPFFRGLVRSAGGLPGPMAGQSPTFDVCQFLPPRPPHAVASCSFAGIAVTLDVDFHSSPSPAVRCPNFFNVMSRREGAVKSKRRAFAKRSIASASDRGEIDFRNKSWLAKRLKLIPRSKLVIANDEDESGFCL